MGDNSDWFMNHRVFEQHEDSDKSSYSKLMNWGRLSYEVGVRVKGVIFCLTLLFEIKRRPVTYLDAKYNIFMTI